MAVNAYSKILDATIVSQEFIMYNQSNIRIQFSFEEDEIIRHASSANK
jgi:hypothetical protein